MSRHKSFPFAIVLFGLSLSASMTATAQVALPEAVESQPLSRDAFSTGTLDPASGALPASLWRGSDPQTVEFLLTNLPARLSAPSLGDAMKRTLLSPGDAPAGAGPSLGGKKLLALARAGFVDEARTVASLSTAERGDPWTGQAEAVADLLDGDVAAACRRGAGLTSGREELFWVRLRVFCYAEADERDAADLTLGILRDQGELSESDDVFLSAATTGALPQNPPAVADALQYAIARKLRLPFTPDRLDAADGGVLGAVARDASLDPATRIDAAERAVAMGVIGPAVLAGVLESVELAADDIGGAAVAARARPQDPFTDAALYQSVLAMSAPEFLRDKAQRIALALGVADSFHRAYALSLLYANEIAALEGTLLSPNAAARFALARMAVGDSVGAGQWLLAMLGPNDSVAALPEAQGLAFIDQVNLLAVLDPLTAAQVARAGDVSLLGGDVRPASSAASHQDPAVTARILEAAFDAALEDKVGQAGLAALAASAGTASGGEIETVAISQSLRAAGMTALRRRYAFERAWAAKFVPDETPPAAEETPEEPKQEEEGGLIPRLKPPRTQ